MKFSFLKVILLLAVPLVFSSVWPNFSFVRAATLIKGPSSPAVYYLYNGNRYAFPNEKTYFTWYYSDFSQVAIISGDQLASIPLVGNITYRPGIRMVKISTDPKVYAVASNGTLRWITTENLAINYYGQDWNKKIDDVSDAFFVNYQIGSPITQVLDYDPNKELGLNVSFVPRPSITDSRSLLVQKKQINIQSYDKTNNAMDLTAGYDAYSIPGSSFRIVCQQPCPISENILRLKTVGAYDAIQKLLSVTQVDIPPHSIPADMHMTSDVECGNYNSIQDGFEGFSGTRWNQGYGSPGLGVSAPSCKGACTGSFACLFEYEKSKESKLTYPLNETNAVKIDSQQLLIHEYTHLLFYDRIYKSPESFPTSLSYYVAGDNGKPVVSACSDTMMSAESASYNLCKKCSFDFSDYGRMFTEADNLYRKNIATDKYKQYPFGGVVSVPQLKNIIDNIIHDKTGQAKDAVADCGYDAWLNLSGCEGGETCK